MRRDLCHRVVHIAVQPVLPLSGDTDDNDSGTGETRDQKADDWYRECRKCEEMGVIGLVHSGVLKLAVSAETNGRIRQEIIPFENGSLT